MVKKSSQSSTTITNSNDKKHLNSLIKVLRPKVYITDSSSFKSLVQELTGNGNGNGSYQPISPTLAPPSVEPHIIGEVPVLDAMKDFVGNPEIMEEFPFDSSELVGIGNPFLGSEKGAPDLTVFPAPEGSSCSEMEYYLSQMSDIESWLLEADHDTDGFSFGCDGYFPPEVVQPEVCIYDYDFRSALI